MKKILLYFFIFSQLIVTLNGQTASISAKISDNNNQPLSGEALVLAAKDSNLLKSAFYTEGVLFLQDIPFQNVLLRVSALGFADTLFSISLNATNPDLNLGTLILNKHLDLKEVTVMAKIPLFKKREDGTVVNIENTLLASSVTSMEVFSKLPNVSVSGNRVNVFGRGEAIIYLNGKQITYERLASLPVSMIKEIEILTNPSAKYDARGRAVININAKKNDKEGLQSIVSQTLTQGKHLMSASTINMNYRQKNLLLSADYGLNVGTDWNKNDYSREFAYATGTYKTFSHYEENSRQTNVSNYKIGLNYEFNEKSDFSLQYDGLYAFYNLNIANKSDNYTPKNVLTTIDVLNNGSTKNRNNSLNANYNLKLDSLGSSLFIGGQYNRFITNLFDQITESIYVEKILNSKALRVNDSKNQIDLYTAQLDWVKAFKKGGKFETGAKFYHITNDGRASIRSKQDGSDAWTDFSQFANSFNYQENVPAAYAQLLGNFNSKWSYTIGLRGELSNITGFSGRLNRYIIDTSYFNLFPNAKISNQISENWSFSLSYAKRINRPIYQNIDPFVWYIDSLTTIQGNPTLTPEFAHSTEGVLSFKNFSLRLGYTNSKNAMRFVVLQGNTGPNSFIMSTYNFEKLEQFNASLDIPIETKIWSSSNTIAVNYNDFQDTRPDFVGRPSTPQLYFYTYNQFTIPKLFTLDINGEFYGKNSDGLRTIEPIYYVTMGINKTFLDKKLNCRLMFNDIFRTQRVKGDRTVGVISTRFDQRFNTHYVRLSATYKFGQLREANYKNKSVNDKEFNRIKQ